MSDTNSWMAKALLISAVIALAIGAGFYLFFRVHQELGIPPAYAWWLGLTAFVVTAIATVIYFRSRAGR